MAFRPFRDTSDSDDDNSSPIRRPAEVYTPQGSPSRSPSKAQLRYSPVKSFAESSHGFAGNSMARNFVSAAEAQTARQQFTLSESPSRRQPVNVDYDGEPYGNIFGDSTRTRSSLGSSKTALDAAKPIFSASTFMAANSDVDNNPFVEVPSLSPSPRVSGDTMRGSFVPKEAETESEESSIINELVHSTAGSGDTESVNDPVLKSSLDKHVFNEVGGDFQPRRHRATQKIFGSRNGNLILDNPVPSILHSFLPKKGQDEFDYMKYSAVTSDPNDFFEDGFTLRANEFGRETEIVVCITMYNEDEMALTRTLHAVFRNIAFLCRRKNSHTWGKDSWKKVVLVIVSDGRNKINPGVLQVLAAIGIYQEGIAKSFVNQKEVKAHLFEYTTQVSIDENLKFVGGETGLVPIQVVFCLKEKNCKKINSHRWLFNAICPILQPNVCVLLDVGTKPHEHAIYNLWKAFDLDSNVAGAAGQIIAMKGKYGRKLFNPLVASQNFEYKMSNILDKPCESAFGYISVLPGALSAYRWSALKNDEDGNGPLQKYFEGERSDDAVSRDIFTANMYLAEDRILAWELVSRKKARWVLKYVSNAKGDTDVPESLEEFISQRRRWLNGAMFAALYSQIHFFRIWQTDHSFIRKLFFHIEFVYTGIMLFFNFFSVANFYISFYYLAGAMISVAGKAGEFVFQLLNYICVCTLLAMLVISMGNRPQGAPKLFLVAVIILSLCGCYALVAGLYFMVDMIKQEHVGLFNGNSFTQICISMASTYGLYVIISFVYLDPWHIFTSALQYFLLLPAYTCLLQIYAYCNTHDVTWGTKGDNLPQPTLGKATIEKDEKGQEVIKLEIIGEQRDIDSMYSENLYKLKERRKQPAEMRDGAGEKPTISSTDYYRDIRSRVVLLWVILNMVLVMVVKQMYDPETIESNRYLEFILYAVFGFSVFRFCGSMGYVCHIVVRNIVMAKNKWDIRKAEKAEKAERNEGVKMMTVPN